MYKLLMFYTLLPILYLAGCDHCTDDYGEEPIDNPRKTISLTASETLAAEKSASFAMAFLKAYNHEFKDESQYVISPLSASCALSMLLNGADGATREEIIRTMGYEGIALSDINSMNRILIKHLPTLDRLSLLTSSNLLWREDNYTVREPYQNLLGNMYDAKTMHSSVAQAPMKINDWCARQTNGLINDIIDRMDPSTRLILLNALYFKGMWAHPFNVNETKNETFTNEDGTTSRVEMMNRTACFDYYEDDDFSMATLPYGNGAFAMHVVLPAKGKTIENTIERWQSTNWNELLKHAHPTELNVKLPKIKIRTKKRLRSTLQRLGIEKMFTNEADLSQISDEQMQVNNIIQAGVIDIDEEGTEAAAVTAVVNVTSSLPQTVNFYVVRPYLFLIREQSTGTILFIGKVGRL